jgi:hypothetical protein
MADYKTLRLKKNAELENAMSNIKKDLYNWKPPSNAVRVNTYSKLSQSKIQTLGTSNLREATLIRSGSLRDINRASGGDNSSGSRKNSNNFNAKLRPISGGDERAKKLLLLDDFSDLDINEPLEGSAETDTLSGTEFLTSFKSNSRANQSNERQYLYTSRSTASLSLKKNSEEIEIELVNLLFLPKLFAFIPWV